MIKAIAGLVPVRSGCILHHGRDITGCATHTLVGTGLAYVPQVDNVFPRMSVAENLELGGFAAPAEAARRFDQIMTLFPDLARLRHLAAGKLSGGQRQMVAVGRALMAGPRVLMLDEPSAGLSPKFVELVFAKLREIRSSGISILMVEQNARAALAISDRGYVLAEGQERFAGPAAALLASPQVGALYLGAGSRLAS
jgi:ABC-type branched-subunit amino acid transport system ATPase component